MHDANLQHTKLLQSLMLEKYEHSQHYFD